MRVVISALLILLALHLLLDSITYRETIDLCQYEGFENDHDADKDKDDDDHDDSDEDVTNKKATTKKPHGDKDEDNDEDEDADDDSKHNGKMKAKAKKKVKGVKEGFGTAIFTNGRYAPAAPPESCFRERDDCLYACEAPCDPYGKKNCETGYQTKKELMDYVQCNAPLPQAANYFISDENDANFQSDVMNLNRFYKQGDNNVPGDLEVAEYNSKQRNRRHMGSTTFTPNRADSQAHMGGVSYSLQPNTWRYEDELPMNGGQFLPGVSGYDTLSDYYSDYSAGNNVLSQSCAPPTRGATMNDDLRMGMGAINAERRSIT